MKIEFKGPYELNFTIPEDPEGVTCEYNPGDVEDVNVDDGEIGKHAQLTTNWITGVAYVDPDFWKNVRVLKP